MTEIPGVDGNGSSPESSTKLPYANYWHLSGANKVSALPEQTPMPPSSGDALSDIRTAIDAEVAEGPAIGIIQTASGIVFPNHPVPGPLKVKETRPGGNETRKEKIWFSNSPLPEAQIVAFAEQHKQRDGLGPHNETTTADRVVDLAQEGDELLVEGLPRGVRVMQDDLSELMPEYSELHPGVKVLGWDDMEQNGITRARIDAALQEMEQTFHHYSPAEFEERVKQMEEEILEAGLIGRIPTLTQSVTESRERIPNSRTIVVAGRRHLVKDGGAFLSAIKGFTYCIVEEPLTHPPGYRRPWR